MKSKIGVLGLWHLGCVSAACLARHFKVVGLDFDPDLVEALNKARAPISEPGLDKLIGEGLREGRLSFHVPTEENVRDLGLLWVTYDTPVTEEDVSDVAFVLDRLRRILAWLRPDTLVVISAQLPVGTCASLQRKYQPQRLRFACVPENLRLGKAIDIFTKPDRIIAGVRTMEDREALTPILEKFSDKLIWMTPESAEMTKHALNSFLAVSIAFMNEVSRLCEHTGADARSVSEGLKSEIRIGPLAYLSPGAAFAGGTLARDVVSLVKVGADTGEKLDVLPAICPSNERHKLWESDRLAEYLLTMSGKIIALLGLTYKPGTDTLRRSAALELAQRLGDAGATVRIWDPVVRVLPESCREKMELSGSAREAVTGAEAVVIHTPWPQFREEKWADLLAGMKRPLVLDAGRFLQRQLPNFPGLIYLSVGVPHET